ncbi:MAG TPA: hypothetical protein VFS96_08035 [Nitrolancea sp.]|nr:hypothetical protein [Nitrolancea sp.]
MIERVMAQRDRATVPTSIVVSGRRFADSSKDNGNAVPAGTTGLHSGSSPLLDARRASGVRQGHDFSRVGVYGAAAVTEFEGEAPEHGVLLTDSDGHVGGPIPTPPGAGPVPSGPGLGAGVPTVTIPADIRASTTPAAMTANRIPPRADTPVTVDVSGLDPTGPPVTLRVEGSGGDNGSATIFGGNRFHLFGDGSATVQLRGTSQTKPGNAWRLRLVADVGATRVAQSNGFSVSAIPQDFSVSFHSLITGGFRGIRVNNSWQSDSGNVADLDEAERSEQVQYGAGSGVLAGAGAAAGNSGYLPAHNPPLVDNHGANTAVLTGVGSITAEQTFIFKDKRTGASDIPMRNSGFRISRVVTQPAPGSLEITTSKVGTATSAKGFASAAGSGSVSRTQAV